LPVPEAALRGAANAIIHKDYSSGTPIQISVYPDRLMLWNPGELLLDWTVAKLKGKHPSQPFNPDVANYDCAVSTVDREKRTTQQRVIRESAGTSWPPLCVERAHNPRCRGSSNRALHVGGEIRPSLAFHP
jgi:ATP-dependent DNA helicase RecG